MHPSIRNFHIWHVLKNYFLYLGINRMAAQGKYFTVIANGRTAQP
ncbi:MAG: hypothetical protein WBP33_11465 [Saprospiraceae bacterium]|nr:hypothetical protein [Saprospiraceae bacterium]